MHITLKFVSHAELFYFPLNLSTAIDGYLCAIVHAKLKLNIKRHIPWDYPIETVLEKKEKEKQSHHKVSNQTKQTEI